jgi:hypothetical protein
MQMLTIQAATPESAQNLYNTLAEFHPELVDQDGKWFVSVGLGSDRQVVQVLDAIHSFLDARSAGTPPDSVVVALDERKYTIRGS